MLLFTTQCKERTLCGLRKYHPRAGGRPVHHRSGDEGRRREARSGRTPPGEAAEGPGSMAERGGEEGRAGQRQRPSRKRCKERNNHTAETQGGIPRAERNRESCREAEEFPAARRKSRTRTRTLAGSLHPPGLGGCELQPAPPAPALMPRGPGASGPDTRHEPATATGTSRAGPRSAESRSAAGTQPMHTPRASRPTRCRRQTAPAAGEPHATLTGTERGCRVVRAAPDI